MALIVGLAADVRLAALMAGRVAGLVRVWARAVALAARLWAAPATRHVVVAGVSLHPSPNALPGSSALQTLTNGIGGWALILSMIGMVIGAAAWALGSHAQNYQQVYVGRRAVLVAALAALIIGAAPALINFFYSTGNGIAGHG